MSLVKVTTNKRGKIVFTLKLSQLQSKAKKRSASESLLTQPLLQDRRVMKGSVSHAIP